MSYPAPGPGQARGGFGPPPAQAAVPGWEQYAQPPVGYSPVPQGPQPWALANIGGRLGARVLDLVFAYLIGAAGEVPLSLWHGQAERSGGETGQTIALALLIAWPILVFVFYYPCALSFWGATLGKKICRVRVRMLRTGAPLGYWRALGRELFWIVGIPISALGLINSLMCTWDRPFQQCLHDKIFGTVALRPDGVPG